MIMVRVMIIQIGVINLSCQFNFAHFSMYALRNQPSPSPHHKV